MRVDTLHNSMLKRLAVTTVAAAATLLAGCSATPYHAPMQSEAIVSLQHRTSTTESFEAAWALLDEGRYAQAEDAFRRCLAKPAHRTYPNGAKMLFWLGYCLEKQGRDAEAVEIYRDLPRQFPSTPAAQRAARRAATLGQP